MLFQLRLNFSFCWVVMDRTRGFIFLKSSEVVDSVLEKGGDTLHIRFCYMYLF